MPGTSDIFFHNFLKLLKNHIFSPFKAQNTSIKIPPMSVQASEMHIRTDWMSSLCQWAWQCQKPACTTGRRPCYLCNHISQIFSHLVLDVNQRRPSHTRPPTTSRAGKLHDEDSLALEVVLSLEAAHLTVTEVAGITWDSDHTSKQPTCPVLLPQHGHELVPERAGGGAGSLASSWERCLCVA